ncbi:MAG TPA: nuclear transport factor 2 family protein [Candidatus Thermoplasmatota archaeon]|nr:nuclear transport factor 2 family protein [Candidatus Thermoplasmatota archaeon]
MSLHAEVASFLARFAAASERRDADAYADLFLRDPAPVVTWSDGEMAHDWLDVRVRVGRDFQRALVDRVVTHGVLAREVSDDVAVVAFDYDIHVRDLWGATSIAARHASLTLLRTKDGWRIAAAHFSAPRR